MRVFHQLPFFGFDAATGFAFRDASDDVLQKEVQCAGTNLATAASFWPAFTEGAIDIKNIVVFAKYVDASNFAIKIPTSNQQYRFTIFASSVTFPSSGSIEAFLDYGTFVDGSNSLVIPAGTGRLLRVVALTGGTPVWGYQ